MAKENSRLFELKVYLMTSIPLIYNLVLSFNVFTLKIILNYHEVTQRPLPLSPFLYIMNPVLSAKFPF